MSDSASKLKYTALDINSIVKMISPLGENEFTNEDHIYWLEALNNSDKTLADLINRLKGNNQIEIGSFLRNPNDYNLNNTYTSNVIISTEEQKIIDPTNNLFTMKYISQNSLVNNSFTKINGKFSRNNGEYEFIINSHETLMSGWGNFKW